MRVHDILAPLMRRFRARRLRTIATELALRPDDHVLDVGGAPGFWVDATVRPRITFLNLYRDAPAGMLSGDEYVCGDGRHMPFQTSSFAAAISNSVIEHVGTIEDQHRFADEIRRVARSYAVQTPDRSFVLEPHFIGLGPQFVPMHWRPAVVRYATVLGWLMRNRPDDLRRLVHEVRLLSASEVRQLFPDASLVRERFLGASKSLLAISKA
jgi:hypothetical protein